MAVEMAKEEILDELELLLKHFICRGIQDDLHRARMADAVEKFVREEVSHYRAEQIVENFRSQENAFRLFMQYLVTQGMVEISDEPDH